MAIQDYINKCNDAFDTAIKGMENHKDCETIRNLILGVARVLAWIGKNDPTRRDECVKKSKMLLECAQDITNKKSYEDVYFKLTGKVLALNLDFPPLPGEENKEPKEEKAPEIKEEAPEKENNDYDNIIFEYKYNWNDIPSISFDDVAGLEHVKEEVNKRVLLPLKNPELTEGYITHDGGGLLLYGPPGTGKTMIAAAIAHEINAKFTTIKVSDILSPGVGKSEQNIAQLFKEARSFDCSVIVFDEFESLCPATTKSIISKQIRSEFLTQIQGVANYGKEEHGKILYLICCSNKPWEIDSAFLRPGRFGTRIFVGLPDFEARKYIINHHLDKIREQNLVTIAEDIKIDEIASACEGYNGSDVDNLFKAAQDISITRALETHEKVLCMSDFKEALEKVVSSVQKPDLIKLKEWTDEFNA